MFWKSHFFHDHPHFIMAYTVECCWVGDETQIQWHSILLALPNNVTKIDYLISGPPSFSEPCLPDGNLFHQLDLQAGGITLWLTLYYPSVTFDPSNVLHSCQGFLLPNSVGWAFSSNLTYCWPWLTSAWPLTPAMHYTLVSGSSYQLW